MVKEITFKNSDKISLVDDEDYDKLIKYKWYYKEGYAATYIKINNKKHKRMHRIIIDAPEGFEIDHIDRNGLNNQKNNLRVVTHQQNIMNNSKQKNSSSKYKGVGLNGSKWRARITFNQKVYYLGRFKSEIDAAEAYNNAAKELFGEYACLNEVNK